MNQPKTPTTVNKIATLLATLLLVMVAGASLHAKTAKYPDPLLTTPVTPAVISKGLEADGYALGVMAYAWGYPLVRMEREMREYINVPDPKPDASYRAPLNQIGWARELATSRAKDMPTANNDTLYMSSVVKLDEPYILSVPDTQDRYYVVNVFTMWHELEHYIGRRTTGTKPGRFVLVPPGWEGTLPADATRLDVSTDKVWLWGRLHVLQGEPIKPLHELQDKFTLVPLSADGRKDFAARPATLKPMPTIGDDELGFFEHLAFTLKANTVKSVDEALFAQFERIGLTKGGFDPSVMTDEVRKGLLRGLADGPAAVTGTQISSGTLRSGWIYTTGLDNFGFNYPLRAGVAGAYLGGNGEKEAVYPGRFTDSDGKLLNGDNRYVIHFKKTPPVDAFWSLTVYNADDKMLVENPVNRYKVGSDTPGLKIRKDGSFDIPIQHNKPEGEFSDNWLPASKGDFYVILRLYQPSDAILSGEYVLPQLDRVK